jgi:lysophospholipase L1-like esterase
MRRPLILMFFTAVAVAPPGQAATLPLAVKQVQVQARPDVADLVCEKRITPPRPARPADPDPMEIPTDDMFEEMTAPGDVAPGVREAAAVPSVRPGPGNFRMGIWGDSHFAAAFFTDELVKSLRIPGDAVSNQLLPANMGRAGVRLPLRRACVSPQWKYEPGYLGRDNTTAPGPGLMNMFSDQAGATLAWDVRKDAQAPGYERVRILYEQTEAPMRVAISVDGDTEKEVVLDSQAGPAALELVAAQPMRQVKLRLVDARFRLQGLELLSNAPHGFQMDVFGYPGATVAGWKSARFDYFNAWFTRPDPQPTYQPPYQLVMLEFGTNEGNVKPFDASTYRNTVQEAVRNMRTAFPTAACVLIAPGDRGVLVPRSANIRKKGARTRKAAAKKIDLLVYSRIHAEIGRIQRQVAQDAGCSSWSMQDAMGGPGQAYKWAHQSPALMAPDLIHFTVAGYQRLAQKFISDMGWKPLQ